MPRNPTRTRQERYDHGSLTVTAGHDHILGWRRKKIDEELATKDFSYC